MNILSRNDFINEVYMPMMEEKKYRELQAVNEGLLKDLFGKIKSLFVDDWKKINGNADIIKLYKEYDDKLTGFTTMKMSKREDCNSIRQNLVEFAELLYTKEKKQMEEAKDEKNKEEEEAEDYPIEKLDFKDKKLQDALDKCKKSIKDTANGDSEMTKWANLLMDRMSLIIDEIMLSLFDDEEKKNEYEEKIKEMQEKAEKKTTEINKEMEEFQNKQLDSIYKERNGLIKSLAGATVPAKKGNNAVKSLCNEFSNLVSGTAFESVNSPEGEVLNEAATMSDTMKNIVNSDKYLGFKELLKTSTGSDDKYKDMFRLMGGFYKSLDGASEKFKDVPPTSVQAMCIATNAFIKFSFFGYKGSNTDEIFQLMAKCAIVSNGVVSYNLPIASDESKKDFNYYSEILGFIAEGKFNKDANGDDITISDKFKANADKLMKDIIEEAKKLLAVADKDYNDQMKKLNAEYKDEESVED